MPVAKETPVNRKRVSIVLTGLVLLMGLIAAGLFIYLNQSQAPAKEAASPSCPVNGAVCKWTTGPAGTKYSYELIDLTTGEKVASGVSEGSSVNFTSQAFHKYRCTVTAIQGETRCPPGSTEATCTATNPTPPPQIPTTPPDVPVATETPIPGCLTTNCDPTNLKSCPTGLTCMALGSHGYKCVKNTKCTQDQNKDPLDPACWCADEVLACPENKKVVSNVQVFCPTCACTGIKCSSDLECKTSGADFVCHNQECVRDGAQKYCDSI